jgi:hypothetical protein
MKIKTNHQFRLLLSWHELTEAEQTEHADAYKDVQQSTFFRYRNWVYDLNDFLRVESSHLPSAEHSLCGWDGYQNETFFSSVVVKYSDCGEAVKVGLALS